MAQKKAVDDYPTDTENREYAMTSFSSPDDLDTEEEVTDEVRAARVDVENTRAELSGTIDAIKEKLSPANLVAEAKEATIGAAQTAVSDAVDSAKEVAHNVVDTAKGVAATVAASISDVVDSAKSAVSGVAQDAGHAAKNAAYNVKEISQDAGDKARGAGATIVETIRLNPIPAAITGIGLGWLITSIRRQNDSAAKYGAVNGSADRFTSTTDEYGQSSYTAPRYNGSPSGGPSSINTAMEKLNDVKDSVTDHASELASSVSGKASDLAHAVGDKATTLGGQAKDTAQSAVSATGSYITGNPLAAGAIAILLGVGVGLLIPSTEKENQLLGETRDRLKDQAAEQFHQVADKVSNVAHTAFDSAKQTVKDEAQQQGLTGVAAPA